MIVRELVTLLKYQVDESGANAFRKGFDRLRDGAARLGKAIRVSGAAFRTGLSGGIRTAYTETRRLIQAQREYNRQQRESIKGAGAWGNAVSMIQGILAGVGVVSVAAIADEFSGTDARINLAIGNEDEAKQVIKDIFAVAQEAGQAYAATGGLFATVQRNATELEMTTESTLKLTENLGKLMAIGGGSAAAQEAALTQLGQALGAGVLRGDELNSIIEQAPRLAQAIAESFGTTVGKLKEMGENGEITAKQLSAGILAQSEKINAEFLKMPRTFGRGVTIMRNAWGRFINDLNKGTRASEMFYRMSELVANNIERIAAVLAFAGAAYGLTKLTAGMGALRLASLAALVPFLRMAALLYGLYLIGEDISVWMEGGKSALGDLIGPASEWSRQLEGVSDTLSTIKAWLGDAALTTGQFLAKWGSILAVGYALVSVVRMVASGVALVLKPVGILARGFVWIATILAGIVGWPAVLAAAIIGTAVLIYKYWDDIKAYIETVWKGLLNFLPDSMAEALVSAINAVKNAVTEAINFLVDKWNNSFLGSVSRGMSTAMDWGGDVVQNGIRGARNMIGGSSTPSPVPSRNTSNSVAQTNVNNIHVTTKDNPTAVANAAAGAVSREQTRAMRSISMGGMPNSEAGAY